MPLQREFAKVLMDAVLKETGIPASAGIGTNLFSAKIALDITAKHAPDNIGYVDEEIFKKTLWYHRPITDFWNVGKGIAKRLEKYSIYDMHGVSQMNEDTLYREFGINAEFLIDHSKCIEPCTIEDIHNYKSKSSSISNSQILFEDYKYEDALLVLKEMIDVLVLELIEKNMMTNSISLYTGYSKDIHPASGGTKKLDKYTNSYKEIVKEFEKLYKEKTSKDYLIRKLTAGLNDIKNEDMISIQLDMFSNPEKSKKEYNLQKAVISIKNKYGKNAILRGMSLEKKAAARIRNKLIGGHNGE